MTPITDRLLTEARSLETMPVPGYLHPKDMDRLAALFREAAALVAALTPTPAQTTTEEDECIAEGCWKMASEGSRYCRYCSRHASSLPAVPGPQEGMQKLAWHILYDFTADQGRGGFGPTDVERVMARLSADARAEGPTTDKCGHYFQADTALCFKCGMPPGHDGSHGWCSQDVLAAARDVSAERKIAVPPAAPGAEDGTPIWPSAIADVAYDFVRHYTKGGGCSNCGGLPHSNECFVGRALVALEIDYNRRGAPSPAPAAGSAINEDTRRLLYALRQKRLVDGLNGRTWDASAHWLWEREIQAVEKRLGEADTDPLTERIGRGDMSSAEAAVVLASRKEAPPPSAGVVPSERTEAP